MTIEGKQKYPDRLGELFNFQGKLAQFWGDWAQKEEPVRIVTFRLSKIGAQDWPGIVGQTPWNPNMSRGNGEVRTLHGDHVHIDTADWKEVKLRYVIPMPRNGKTYTWKWSDFMREWRQDPFPLCSDCRQIHSPDLGHCTWCGLATKSGAYCRLCLVAGRHELSA